MSNYNVNTLLPSANKVTDSIPAITTSSSTFIPLIPVALDPSNVQADFDAYLTPQAGTTESSIVVTVSTAVGTNELKGHWCYTNLEGTVETRVIQSNTAAAASANSTITLETPFSDVPSSAIQTRLWRDWYYPTLHVSVSDFAETYLDTDTSGNTDWTYISAVRQSLQEMLKNGSSLFIVIPVPLADDATQMVENFKINTNTTLKQNLLSLSVQPDLLVFPCMQSIFTLSDGSTTLSSANYATIQQDHLDYIAARATTVSVDEKTRELVYLTDTSTDSVSSASTHKVTTLGSTSERAAMYHGEYLVSGVTAGTKDIVSPACAAAGIINRISVQSPESTGHAIEGEKYAKLASNFGLRNDAFTYANRLSLEAAGVNCWKPTDRGTWLESSWTLKKTSSTTGANPLEYLHVILTRAKLWNSAQPILSSMISEPNTVANRTAIYTRLTGLFETFKRAGQIVSYTLNDVTTSTDVQAATARWELEFVCPVPAKFVELKLTASFSQ